MNKFKLLCLSDLHGNLIDLPLSKECDAIIISGDICPLSNHSVDFQKIWYEEKFLPWVRSLQRSCYFTFGNHDFFAQYINPNNLTCEYNKQTKTEIIASIDTTLNINIQSENKIKVGFTPGSLPFYDWAFNYPEEKIKEVLDSFGKCDIIVSHGPAFGLLDKTIRGEHVGSHALREYIDEFWPSAICVGHIHSSVGVMRYGETVVVNASCVDEQYKLVNTGTVVEIDL